MGREQDDELREAVIATLGADAVAKDALRAALGEPWATTGGGRDELDQLLRFDTTFTTVSLGVVHVPSMLEGTTWTVWIDADDAADGFVRALPSLAALIWWWIGSDVELLAADGRHLGVLETDGWMLDDRDTDVVLGPDGWLDDMIGRWASIDVIDGAVRWSPVDAPPAATDAQVAAIREGFERALRRGAGRSIDVEPPPPGLRFVVGEGPIYEALLADRPAFLDAPIPPLTELYGAAGLVGRDGILTEEGFDWDEMDAWQTRNRLRSLGGLDAQQAAATAELLRRVDDWSDGDLDLDGEDATAATSGDPLGDGDVAAAFWDELARDEVDPDLVNGFIDSLPPSDASALGWTWLRARALDRQDDAGAAMVALERVVRVGCEHGPALVDLAGYRADQGDAVGALRLLAQAGIGPPDEHEDDREATDGELLWDEVEEYATHRPRPTARRNDPCPCGSGRKYKVCHLGRETHSMDDRAGWLYRKAQRFLRDRHPDDVHDLIDIIADATDDPDRIDELFDAPFVVDVALHEGAVFAEFLAARDRVLPDDEALLAAQWSLVERSVFEIVDALTDRVELRDLVQGELVTVVNTTPNEFSRPGVLLIGRPLPVGATHRAFGGFMPVPPRRLDATLVAVASRDPYEIAAVVGEILRPPRLTNTDGEDLVAHTVTWHVPTPADVADALAAAGLDGGADGHWSLVRDSKNQPNTIIATVQLDGEELTADVNSVERADEVSRLVARALPEADLIDVDARPFEIPRGGAARTDDLSPPDMDDPMLRAALEEFVADAERRWLDEPVPALAGRTPRQAAADPIGREDLRRLLASFPVPADGQPGAMNPLRLHAALGL